MPELRRDPVVGRWVIVATDRVFRPTDFHAERETEEQGGFCPFCEGHEEATPPEILAYRERGSRPNGPGWRVRVVPNRFPALMVEGNLDKRGEGIYDRMNGIGAHEVIIETPAHAASLAALSRPQVQEVIYTYRDRMVDLKRDLRFAHGVIFKNAGQAAGASLQHTHTQLIVTPSIPKVTSEELRGSQDFFRYRGRCLFCDMLRQEAESGRRLVLEEENFVAFCPYAPRFPFEVWILPRAHSSHFENIQTPVVESLAEVLRNVLARLEQGLDRPPYNFVLHSSPYREPELEYYHWHMEIIPRLVRVAGFEWGTDFYINPVAPEDGARFLREIED